MRVIIAAIHGILTSETDPSWPDRFSEWMYERDREVHVTTRHYFAGPFPRWNCWVKDPWLARGLANELELFLRGQGSSFSPPVWLVAHSNGAVIALLVTKRLIARGYQIGGLILTGAACEADVARSGVLGWRAPAGPGARPALGAAIAYSSEDDAVVAGDARAPANWLHKIRDWLWGKLMWPYGCLGRTGWLEAGKPFSQPPGVYTRWYQGGHGCYFAPENIEATFEQIYQDIQEVETSATAFDSQPSTVSGPRPATINLHPFIA